MEQGRVHSVDLLEMALATAARIGYRIREDALDGSAGGRCELKGQRWLLLDPALPARERLQLVLEVLADDPAAKQVPLPAALANVLGRAA